MKKLFIKALGSMISSLKPQFAAADYFEGKRLSIVTVDKNQCRSAIVFISGRKFVFENLKEHEFQVCSDSQIGLADEFVRQDDMFRDGYSIKKMKASTITSGNIMLEDVFILVPITDATEDPLNGHILECRARMLEDDSLSFLLTPTPTFNTSGGGV